MTRGAQQNIIIAMKEENSATENSPYKKAVQWGLIKKYLIITLGCILFSLGVSLFVEPANLTSGGVTGIALIINAVSGFDTGYLVIILNVPMIILGFVFLGWKFMLATAYATTLSGLLMRLWGFVFGEEALNCLPFTDSVIVNAVLGAVLFGVGMGLIFRMGACTAGTDIIVKTLRKKFRHIKTGVFSMTIDLIVVGSSFFTTGYDLDKLFYSVLLVVVFTYVFTRVLYGGDSAQLVFLITDAAKAEIIRGCILSEVDSGVTILDGEGGYTREDKKILLCVIKPYLYPHLRDVVAREDKAAFMVVTSANEIYGFHYKNQDDMEV